MERKTVIYEGFNRCITDAKVAYIILGKEVYFSGISHPRQGYTSTIMAAESVIKTICRADKIDVKDYTFFDIQTHRGYTSKDAGDYCIDQVVVHGSLESLEVKWKSVVDVYHWTSQPMDEKLKTVIDAFKDLIYT